MKRLPAKKLREHQAIVESENVIDARSEFAHRFARSILRQQLQKSLDDGNDAA